MCTSVLLGDMANSVGKEFSQYVSRESLLLVLSPFQQWQVMAPMTMSCTSGMANYQSIKRGKEVVSVFWSDRGLWSVYTVESQLKKNSDAATTPQITAVYGLRTVIVGLPSSKVHKNKQKSSYFYIKSSRLQFFPDIIQILKQYLI